MRIASSQASSLNWNMPAAVEPFPGVAVVAKPLSRQATARSNEGARPAAVACGATALITHGGANGSSRLMLDGAGGGGRGRAGPPCAVRLAYVRPTGSCFAGWRAEFVFAALSCSRFPCASAVQGTAADTAATMAAVRSQADRLRI